MTTTQTINFYASVDLPPKILLPDPTRVFAVRQQRFAALASGHTLGDWLRYLEQLTAAQHACAVRLAPHLAGDADAQAQAMQHRMPPLNAGATLRPECWIDAARQIAAALYECSAPPMRERLDRFRDETPDWFEAIAEQLIDGQPDPQLLPETTLVAASLQVVWTVLAARLDATGLAPLDVPGLCPCCGSLPVGSIIRTSTQVNNLRYLHCALCNTEWNVPRSLCTACGNDKALNYRQIDGSSGAVRAECCDHCHSYLKIVAQEKDPDVDPVADDLATIALDLLVDEAGYARSGPNLLLLGGAA